MHVRHVPAPGTDLSKPSLVALAGQVAHRLLDRGGYKNSFHVVGLGGVFEHRELCRTEIRICCQRIDVDHGGWLKRLQVIGRQTAGWHRGQPDVCVESDLMGIVAGGEGASAGLSKIADQQARMTIACNRLGEAFHKADEDWMTPRAVAGGPQHLPVWTTDRDLFGSGDTPARVRSKDAGGVPGWALGCGKLCSSRAI